MNKSCGTDVRHPSIPSFHRYEGPRQVAKPKRVMKVMEWISPLNQLWPRFPSLNLVTEGNLSWREASGCRRVMSCFHCFLFELNVFEVHETSRFTGYLQQLEGFDD